MSIDPTDRNRRTRTKLQKERDSELVVLEIASC